MTTIKREGTVSAEEIKEGDRVALSPVSYRRVVHLGYKLYPKDHL